MNEAKTKKFTQTFLYRNENNAKESTSAKLHGERLTLRELDPLEVFNFFIKKTWFPVNNKPLFKFKFMIF